MLAWNSSTISRLLAVLGLALLLVSPGWAKPKFKVLARVPGGLYDRLTFDAQGNLYGETGAGGTYNGGIVFKLTPNSKGKWTLTTLHNFNCATDGCPPKGGLTFDSAGNLYGTAFSGAAHDNGTAFELSPVKGGWSLHVLHDFDGQPGGSDGGGPSTGLILDMAGNLYGTTADYGLYSAGVTFELSPSAGAIWDENLIYSFGSIKGDTQQPGDLVFHGVNTLIGFGSEGGLYGGGTVFRLTHRSDGQWKDHTLYSFCPKGDPCVDGLRPQYIPALDGSGDIYGTTRGGGENLCNSDPCGTVFELSPMGNGHWKESVLYNFPKPTNGYLPSSGLLIDSAGNLFGTTAVGGSGCTVGCGTVYEMQSLPNGRWKYVVLHKFGYPNGALPQGGLIRDGDGNLYGTAYDTVFEITP